MIRNTSSGRRAARPGFTLIELLVVLTIIVIIFGISIGVYFRVRQTQTESAAITTVNKLQSQLDQQWKAVMDNARDDARAGRIGAFATNVLGGGDSRRELVIWTKMQLKLEFPRSFDEAVNWPGTVGLNAKSSYYRAIQNAGISPLTESNLTDDQILQESAVLLYMSLTQGRRGITAFSPVDHLGPHAVGETTLLHYSGSATFKVFIDSWGQPISFIRWPVLSAAGDEINQAPFATFSSITGYQGGKPFVVDPQDPEATLFLNWSPGLQSQFKNNIHNLGNVPTNMSPFIVSSGRDRQFGLTVKSNFARTPGPEDDNIYGYRSRGVGRH